MLTDYEAYVRVEPHAGDRDGWRRQLLALMAGERALLLSGLLGLAEATLTRAEVFEGYTVGDLLAHIAAWDDFHRERLRLALAGRAGEIVPIELHEHNATLHRAHQSWTLARSVAALQRARTDFLEALAEAPDEALHRPVSIPWADSLPMRTWAVWRARHDAVHGEEIAGWRATDERAYEEGPAVILQAALAASRDELETLAALAPEVEREQQPVYGTWTLRDIFGHLADWEALALRCLKADGTPETAFAGDVQAWNEAHAGARREQSWQAARADYLQARASLLAWIGPYQERMARVVANPLGKDTTAYHFIHGFLQHEREHAQGLREALLLLPGDNASS